ncbi:MAG: VWA domain-containing protein [Aggregatilineales bacterium]
MTFVHPEALYLLLLLPAAALAFAVRARIRRARWRSLGESQLIASLAPDVSPVRRSVKMALWLLAAGMLIIALARPTWGTDVEAIETQGVSVMIVLDVSRSMLARDVLPSRLEHAKLSVLNLIEKLAGSEIGLILFAGQPLIQFPLTTDTRTLGPFVNAASADSISQQGTNLADALLLAVSSFDQKRPTAKNVVVISDGEGHRGNPLDAAAEAAAADIKVHAVGYGDPAGAPIPVLDSAGRIAGYRTNPDGSLVLSRLDEETLREIANRAGGLYQRADSDNAAISAVAEAVVSERSDALGRSIIAVRGVERFSLFLLLAAAALGLEMAITETRRPA